MSATSCWYGESFTRKTTQLGLAAVYQYEITGHPCRMIFTDNASVEHIQDIIDAGFIDFRRIDTANYPRSLIIALLNGDWWPAFKDSAGIVKLIPAGHALVAGAGPVPMSKLDSTMNVVGVNNLSKCGGYMIETLGSIGDILMRHMTEEGHLLGEHKATVYTEPSYRMGKTEERKAPNSLMQYGGAQTDVMGFISRATQLAVPRVFWTTHEAKGKDELTGESTLGPLVVGKALTSKIAKNMGDLFHFESSEVQETRVLDGVEKPVIIRSVRAYYTKHRDVETGMMWPAGPRVSAVNSWAIEDEKQSQTNMEKLRTRFPGGFVDLNKESMVDYLRFKDTELAVKTDVWKRHRELVDKRREETSKVREGLEAQLAMAAASAEKAEAKTNGSAGSVGSGK